MLTPDQGLRILFLHHSTGRNLIQQGAVRELVAMRNLRDGTNHEFWDHDYNEIGLSGPSGELKNISFDLPDDNTDPDGFDLLFSQPVHDPPDNALSHILQFDVIVFKSCFPVSAIGSHFELEEYKQHYLRMRETFARHPHILFVVMTQPPLIPSTVVGSFVARKMRWMWTNAEDAARARQFSRWLHSQEFRADLPNAVTFDFFDMLAEPADSDRDPNTLRPEYRSGRFGYDAHPNEMANRAIAPIFVGTIMDSISVFQQAASRQTVEAHV